MRFRGAIFPERALRKEPAPLWSAEPKAPGALASVLSLTLALETVEEGEGGEGGETLKYRREGVL